MGSNTQDACYLALLALAEEFRTMNPPNIRNCIQCLVAIFNLKQPPKVEARTHLQLGNILLQHTKNTDLAQSHLEKAVSIYTLHPKLVKILIDLLTCNFLLKQVI